MEYSPARSSGRRGLTLALQVVVLLCTLATFSAVYLYGSHSQSQTTVPLQAAPAVGELPASFVLPDDALTPAKDQAHRGTCWIFSSMGVLESSYKKNGIKKGYLKENEYVPFSEQAYGIGFVRYCQNNKTDPYCFAGPAKNQTHDGEPEWLYYMNQKVTKYVLPYAVCPYFPTDADEFKCEGFDEAVESNPIKLSVNGVQSAYTIDAIKRLLYEKQVALAWSHAVYEAAYMIPCSDELSGLSDSEQCQKCEHPCTTSADGCCAELVLPGYTKQGVFGMHRWPHVSGGHAMLVVGWNDNFRVDTGLPGAMHERMVGGLIIKNSWGSVLGHTAAYWGQKHSLADESFLCPEEESSVTWIPADGTCMLANPDPLKCADGLEKIIRKTWVKGATVLKCTSKALTNKDFAKSHGWSDCQQGMNYVLEAVSAGSSEVKVTVPAGSDGYLRFHLVGWNDTVPAKRIMTNASSWYGMENLLTPVSTIGNSNQCGFFFVPYDVFTESTVRFPAEGHDTPVVSYLDVKWDDASYARSPSAAGKDYTLLKNSLRTMKLTKFNGPFDWEADTNKK